MDGLELKKKVDAEVISRLEKEGYKNDRLLDLLIGHLPKIRWWEEFEGGYECRYEEDIPLYFSSFEDLVEFVYKQCRTYLAYSYPKFSPLFEIVPSAASITGGAYDSETEEPYLSINYPGETWVTLTSTEMGPLLEALARDCTIVHSSEDIENIFKGVHDGNL